MKKEETSIDQMNRWAKIKCEKCGGHGGGHYEECPKRKKQNG